MTTLVEACKLIVMVNILYSDYLLLTGRLIMASDWPINYLLWKPENQNEMQINYLSLQQTFNIYLKRGTSGKLKIRHNTYLGDPAHQIEAGGSRLKCSTRNRNPDSNRTDKNKISGTVAIKCNPIQYDFNIILQVGQVQRLLMRIAGVS